MTKNPNEIDIIWCDGSDAETETIENVETWWYEDTNLKIEKQCGTVRTFPSGDVIIG